MTKTTEELKREMYDAFLEVSKYSGCGALLDLFESRLEAYLEALRKAMVTINESTVSCAQHSAEAFIDLETRLDRMTEERDTIRNKLQAFEFANRSAAELLSEALREPSGLRKPAGSMAHQKQPEVVPHDDSKVLPGRRFSKEQCAHENIYKDIVAGPRTFRCADCGAESELWGQL